MSCKLVLEGAVVVGGDGCGCSGSDGSSVTTRGLALACSVDSFQAIKSTDCALSIATAGSIGQNWIELPVALSAYQFLSLKSSAAVRLRIGAAPATIIGAAGVFPATTINGSPFAFTADGVAVAFNFAGASLSAAQVAAQINAAAITAGLDFLPAVVNANGQLTLTGKKTGADGSLAITTGIAAIGLPTAATPVKGAGSDLDVWGALLVQFGTANAPSRIQISGSASVEILAAGTP